MTTSPRRSRRQREAERSTKTQLDLERDAAWADTYIALTDRITAARLAVSADARHPRSWAEQRAEHQLLTSLLGDAVGQAFAAAAANATRPPGVTSWVAEGLARSTERENAIFAAIDVG